MISTIRSICTSPGKVPEDVEFDITSDTSSHNDLDEVMNCESGNKLNLEE